MTDKTQKLTIEKILEKKKIIDEKENKPYYCDYFHSTIDIENHSIDKVADIVNKQYDSPIRADLELIYAFCPIFRSTELQKQLDVNDPVDTVSNVFSNNIIEIQKLAKYILSRYGLNVDKVSTIKKQ